MWFLNTWRPRLAATVLTLGLLAGPSARTVLASSSPSFSGQATVVRAHVAGIPILLADTGALPPSGGAQDASLLNASVPGVLSAEVLHASTVAQGSTSRSEASVANISLMAGGNTIAADFLMARATATCGSGGASTSGSSEVVGLAVNGKSVTVSGSPNQTVSLPAGGQVIINEQSSSSSGSAGSMTVNALHVTVPDVAGVPRSDVIISSAHADITCPPPGQTGGCGNGDFVTGGGWITTDSGARGNFAVAGGIKNGGFWGHLEYKDHGTGGSVHGTGVTAYTVTGPTSRHIEGTAEVNGQPGFTYEVDVADNGEPGRNDTFAIQLSNGYKVTTRTLGGGNIQLHQPC